MMYQNLSWPSNPDPYYYNYDHSIMVGLDPGANAFYFWSVQFWFQDGTAAYMGVQTDVLSNDGNYLGKGVNVAMWNASDAQIDPNAPPGTAIRPNTDGESGLGLYAPWAWQAGVEYRMRVWEVEADDQGIWWLFTVANMASGDQARLGSLKSTQSMGRLSAASVVWTEYYGPNNTAPCLDPTRKPTSVLFLNPARNDGKVTPVSTSLQTPACSNYLISQPTFAALQQVTKTGG
jgi:hypothetical protein